MANKQFTVYRLVRHEYKKDFFLTDKLDENGDEIVDCTITYTGEKTHFLHHDKKDLLSCNSITEWKAEIISTHQAIEGHLNNGTHAYDIHRKPITLLD